MQWKLYLGIHLKAVQTDIYYTNPVALELSHSKMKKKKIPLQ